MIKELELSDVRELIQKPDVPALKIEQDFSGLGTEILLQGFHWDSWKGSRRHGKKNWHVILAEHAPAIKSAPFDAVWFPPPSDSLSPQGYMPRQWHVFDTAYGSEAELKHAIAELKPVQAIADLVLNHRVGMRTSGPDFENPAFESNRQAVVCDDNCGTGCGGPDTGRCFDGARDLDHTNPDVQRKIVDYLLMLRDRLGFSGWRYDMVIGYGARFVGLYNERTRPSFSIGEFWDDRDAIERWIDGSRAFDRAGNSMAFDFPTRSHLHTAVTHNRYRGLKSVSGRPAGLIGHRPKLAVTFVDNHDTERRRRGENGTVHFEDSAVLQAYAYLLTHPGVPCIFWSHFFELGNDIQSQIKTLMNLRRRTQTHSASTVHILEARDGLYAALIGNLHGNRFEPHTAIKLGSENWNPGRSWNLATFGHRYAVWQKTN